MKVSRSSLNGPEAMVLHYGLWVYVWGGGGGGMVGECWDHNKSVGIKTMF